MFFFGAVTSTSHSSSFREALQLLALLSVVRNSVESPCQKLPRASVMFLAEASVAALNPAAPVYSHINRFLLKRASLQLHGVPMLSILHSGLSGVSSHSQSLARELAIAATTAVSHNVKVAAHALASPDSLSVSTALIRGVVAASQSPITCCKLLHKGTLTHLAAVVSQCLCSIAATSQITDQHSSAEQDCIMRGHIVVAALSALITFSRVKKLWRADTLQVAAAEYSSLLCSLLHSTTSFAHRLVGTRCAEHLQARKATYCWRSGLVDIIVVKLLHLARSVLVHSRVWCTEQASALNLTSPFWTALVQLSSIRTHTPICRETSIADCQINALRECLLCLPADVWPTSGPVSGSGSPDAPDAHPLSDDDALLPEHCLWPIILHDSDGAATDKGYLEQLRCATSRGCSLGSSAAQNGALMAFQDSSYQDQVCNSGEAAEGTLVRCLAWTVSAVLQKLASNKEQWGIAPPSRLVAGEMLRLDAAKVVCVGMYWLFVSACVVCIPNLSFLHAAGELWVRDVLCYAGAASCMGAVADPRASVKAAHVAKLVLTMGAILRHWEGYVNSTDTGTLGRDVQRNVGGHVIGAAEALRAVAAGVQSLTDMWEETLTSQGGDGSAADGVWTLGTVLQYICGRAQALDS